MKAASTINTNGRNVLVVRILLVITAVLFCSASFASNKDAEQSTSSVTPQQYVNSGDKPSLTELNDSYKFKIAELKSENELLIKKLAKLEANLNALTEKSPKPSEKLSFAEWAGILLACVAVIITVLGVVVALFSFIGYKKVLDSAKDTAGEVANKRVAENIHDSTRKELQALFSNKALFDKRSAEYKNLAPVRDFLLEAVAKVIYRDIQFDTSDNESDTENDE